MIRLSFTAKRIIFGIALAQMLFFVANYYWLHFFEPHQKTLMTVGWVLAAICVVKLLDIEEIREYRAKKRAIDKENFEKNYPGEKWVD